MTATLTGLRTRTVIKRVCNLSPEVYTECENLTFSGNAMLKGRRSDQFTYSPDENGDPGYGLMHPEMAKGRQGDTHWAVYLRDEDGRMVGWSLVFPRRYGTGWEAYFYVHPDMRRRGVGTRLYRSVRRKFGIVRVHRWDSRATGFFDRVAG